jgi:hypothetical protein
VGVVQDILISLSFQKNAKLIMDPSKSQDQPAGICVNCPVAELACRPSLRSSRASEANVPERAIAHRQKRADRHCSMRQVREAINQNFKVAIRRPVHVCPDIPRVSQGTRRKSYSYSASISNLRGAGHPAAHSAAARRPALEDGLAANFDLAWETPILAFGTMLWRYAATMCASLARKSMGEYHVW